MFLFCMKRIFYVKCIEHATKEHCKGNNIFRTQKIQTIEVAVKDRKPRRYIELPRT